MIGDSRDYAVLLILQEGAGRRTLPDALAKYCIKAVVLALSQCLDRVQERLEAAQVNPIFSKVTCHR
jgi:hypothetical protein